MDIAGEFLRGAAVSGWGVSPYLARILLGLAERLLSPSFPDKPEASLEGKW